MIAHVAEAGEERGRVVLQLTSGQLHPIALEAALRIAAAFKSEIESLFVEDERLFDIAAFPFSREVSLCGRRREALTPERISQQMQHLSASLHRRIAAMARAAEIPFKATIVRSDPVAAAACACDAVGPWNVIALAEPVTNANVGQLRQLLDTVSGATGVIIVGRNAKRTTGPIIAAIDDVAHLEAQLRTAERLVGPNDCDGIHLVLIGQDDNETAEMEGQARLLLEANSKVSIARASPRFGSIGEVIEMLRRAKPGFIIARFGGLIASADDTLRDLTQSLECPLFLMK